MINNFGLTNGEARMLLFRHCLQLKVIKEADRVADLAWNGVYDLGEVMSSTSRRIIYADHLDKTARQRTALAAVLPADDVTQVINAADAIDFAQALVMLSLRSDHLAFLDGDRKENDRD